MPFFAKTENTKMHGLRLWDIVPHGFGPTPLVRLVPFQIYALNLMHLF